MTKANTQVIAKVAAIVAGLGLVLSSFALAMPAQAQTTTTTVTFTRDLTIGSTGADVTALQTWLIGKGFSIPAGATGYFGTQTQAAVAAYQAANGITPAAGYFGPITRAKVNAGGGASTGGDDDDDDDDDNDGSLDGGEADLSEFEFNSENSSGDEGEEDVEIATAEFEVEDGDVRVERFELMASSTGTGVASDRPWDYFDSLRLMVGDDEIGEIDASDRDEWDEEDDDIYRAVFSGLSEIFSADENAEITVVGDVSGSLDSDDISTGGFDFYVEDEGIRARDGEGIDHYIGEDDGTETVDFGFGAEESGDLNIESSDEDPETMTLISDDDESDEYTVFVFELDNQEDADVLITDLTIDVVTASTTVDAEDLLSDATLMIDGDDFDGDISATAIVFEDMDLEIAGDESVTVELVVRLRADAAAGGSATISFDIDGGAGGDIEAEGVDSGDDSDVSGSAASELHTVAEEGIVVHAVSTSSSVNNDGNVGTFRITFEVEALEEDVYIYNGADNLAASTTGVVYTIYQGGTATTTAFAVDSAILADGSNVDEEGSFYHIDSGDTGEFTLTVTIDPTTTGTALYYIELETVYFDDNNDGSGGTLDSSYSVPDEGEFETDPESIEAS